MIYFIVFCMISALEDPLHKSLTLRGLTQRFAGRILGKVIAEISADGPLSISEMEELLEEDDERFLFQSIIFQENEEDPDQNIIELANHCISALFVRQSRFAEKNLLNNLQENNPTSLSTDDLRTKLKEIRISRKSPPKILIPS